MSVIARIEQPLGRPLGRLDAALGRLPMYRVVSLGLGVLVLWSYFLLVTQSLPAVFTFTSMTVTLLVLLVASVASNLLLGLAFRHRGHSESAVITALLLWFLYWPQTDTTLLTWLAAAAVLANASKYAIAVRGRHLFNPAATGVVIVLIVQELLGSQSGIYTSWWIATEPALIPVIITALLVLWRVRKVDVGLVFVALAGVLVVLGLLNSGTGLGDAVFYYFVSTPALFLAGFMLSEPLTLPPRRYQQFLAAAIAALVFAWPQFQSIFFVNEIDRWVFESTAELALLASGLVGFLCGQRGGIRLRLKSSRRLAGDVWELTFASKRPVRFVPGQYLELGLPHRRPDLRGVRRPFSIVSPVDADGRANELSIALRVPEPASSFKRALLDLEPGARLSATSISGDFCLNEDAPIVLIAGGIGVTPFLSQVRSPGPEHRDLVLVYGVQDGREVAYRDELVAAGIPVVLVSPEPPSDLPANWQHIAAPFVRVADLAEALPDLSARTAYVSGPPAMVAALHGDLRAMGTKVRTDAFSGY